jgi:flagellar hook protein FlgE
MLSVTMAGLNAAQKSMDVASNNMANANTVGFKRSYAAFGDVFSSDPSADPKTSVGSGVLTSAVARDTTAGSVSTTGRVTDLAIDGRGFFLVRDPSAQGDTFSFTRAGNFNLDAAGYLVDNSGNQLIGYKSVQSLDGNGAPVLDAYGNPVMTADVNGAKQAMRIIPQYTTGQALPDGTITGQEIQSLSFSAPATANGNITLNGVVNGQPITTTVAVAKGDDAATIAKNVQTQLSQVLSSKDVVTVTGSGDNSKVKIAFNVLDGAVSPFTVETPIATSPSVSTKTAFTSGPQVQQIVMGAATATGNITVAGVTVPVTAGDTATTVAQKVQAALAADAAFSGRTVAVDSTNSDAVNITFGTTESEQNLLGFSDTGTTGVTGTLSETQSALTRKVEAMNVTDAMVDQSINVGGVNVDVSAGDTAAVVANKIITALNQAYPGRSATYDATNGQIDFTFLASDANAALVTPKYTNKRPTAGTVTEVAKGGSDPVLMQSVSISPKGEIVGTYSNGASYSMGFVAIATFANDAGLKDIGGNRFAQTGASGTASISSAGAPKAGNIMSGEIEQSNVDITNELMTMIRAQQVYNGNARVLQTVVDTVTKITDLR